MNPLNLFKYILGVSKKTKASVEPQLGFWNDLNNKCRAVKHEGGGCEGSENEKNTGRPICVLAPMADVTDCAFRYVINKYGKPDVLWTEFVSADGLVRASPEGKKKLLADLKFEKEEKLIVAQLFGSNPKYMEDACRIVEELGYDGIDINMGCPDKSIERQKAGASMMKNPKLAKEIIFAAKRGAPNIPITVKTRVGYNKDELDSWLRNILEASPSVVTIHARTRKEMSKVPANWNYVKRAVEIRNEFQKDLIESGKQHTLIFGNGDVVSVADAYKKAEESGADGVMIGRGIFGNPWLFSALQKPIIKNIDGDFDVVQNEPTLEEKLNVMIEHTQKFQDELGSIKNFAVMKKHFKAYVNGFDGAKELRTELMDTNNVEEVRGIIEGFLVK
jgi:nifR3 family TIM-barrel protein